MDVRSGYVFGAGTPHADEHHRCLNELYDPFTIARLERTGIADGWDCLEVGAGNGSIATWLAERVAPGGHVLATDLAPERIRQTRWLSAARHDIVGDPLPEDRFDLVHVRLVLQHLPERDAVLAKLVRALKPGGVLQVEESDAGYSRALVVPDPWAGEVYAAFCAAKAKVWAEAGADNTWGSRLPQAMHDAGLVDVDPVPHLEPWRAGSPGVRLQIHHTHHLREQLLAAGLTERQLAEVRVVMSHPDFVASSMVLYSVRGRRPR